MTGSRIRFLSALLSGGLMVGCATTAVSDGTVYDGVRETTMMVAGLEGGPHVPRLVIALRDPVTRVDARQVIVKTAGVVRRVKDVFVSDARGRPTEGSNYITVELETRFDPQRNGYEASPFAWNDKTFHNEWVKSYPVEVLLPSVTVGGARQVVRVQDDPISRRISEDAALFDVRGQFSGRYDNPLTRRQDELTLRTAAYEPDSLKDDGRKNPLVIWLHGQGEGGTDPDIALLGNEVTALAKPAIQSRFHSGNAQGAYVLVVQSPTYWMDEGDGTNGGGAGPSRYRGILMDTIRDYLKSNPDVDTGRILLLGLSNGGYMTMEMILEHPHFFAAAMPICEAYSWWELERDKTGRYVQDSSRMASLAFTPTLRRWMTDEKIRRIRHMPLWFVASADDQVVLPQRYALPTYQALLKAGAQNAWFSYFESVQGIDIPGSTFMGHFSWVPVLNDQVGGVQDRDAIRRSTDSEQFGFRPDNAGQGGEKRAVVNGKTHVNAFDWLNDQRRQPAE